MSLDPEPALNSAPAVTPETNIPVYRWHQKTARVIAAAFCMALGIFLVIAPWIDPWQESYLPSLGIQWRGLWINPYFRGAVSGLGVLDIYIAIHEIVGINVNPHHRHNQKSG